MPIVRGAANIHTHRIYAKFAAPIDNIARLLRANADREAPPPPLYCELLELHGARSNAVDDDDDTRAADETKVSWRESCRWIRYEQTLEGGASRWSKPHLTLLGIQPLLQARNALKRGLVLLDYRDDGGGGGGGNGGWSALVAALIAGWREQSALRDEHIETIRRALDAPKFHKRNGKMRRAQESEKSSVLRFFCSYFQRTQQSLFL